MEVNSVVGVKGEDYYVVEELGAGELPPLLSEFVGFIKSLPASSSLTNVTAGEFQAEIRRELSLSVGHR